MSDNNKPVRGLRGDAKLGARIARTRGVLLPDTAAGGNIQLSLDDGSRITAWKGTSLFQVAKKLKDGDEFDFTYTGTRTQGYPDSQTGNTIEYTEYLGVEIVGKATAIGGVRKGAFDEVPEEIADREDTELVEIVKKAPAQSAAEKAAALAGDASTVENEEDIPAV